jgi:hypothetical protein
MIPLRCVWLVLLPRVCLALDPHFAESGSLSLVENYSQFVSVSPGWGSYGVEWCWVDDALGGYRREVTTVPPPVGTTEVFDDWRRHPPTCEVLYNGELIWQGGAPPAPPPKPEEGLHDGIDANGNLWEYSASSRLRYRTESREGGLSYVYLLQPWGYGYTGGVPYGIPGPQFDAFLPSSSGLVMGVAADDQGRVFVTLEDNQVHDVTPEYREVPWYQYWCDVVKLHVPQIDWSASGLLSASERGGFGYDAAKRYEVARQAGEMRGELFQNGFGELVSLSEARAWTWNARAFAVGFQWHQDVEGGLYFWNPLQPTRITRAGMRRFGEPVESPPGWGNDVTDLGDSSPDRALCLYLADAPGILLSRPEIRALPQFSVIALRLGARQWVTWSDAVASSLLRWSVDITIMKLSPAGYWAYEYRLLNHSYSPADVPRPLSVHEATTLAGWQ